MLAQKANKTSRLQDNMTKPNFTVKLTPSKIHPARKKNLEDNSTWENSEKLEKVGSKIPRKIQKENAKTKRNLSLLFNK